LGPGAQLPFVRHWWDTSGNIPPKTITGDSKTPPHKPSDFLLSRGVL